MKKSIKYLIFLTIFGLSCQVMAAFVNAGVFQTSNLSIATSKLIV